MRRLNAQTATVVAGRARTSVRRGNAVAGRGSGRKRSEWIPRQCTGTVRHGSSSQDNCEFRMELRTNSNYIPTQHGPFLEPRYSVFCAVRTGYLKLISSQFTAKSVVLPPCEFCGAGNSTGTDFCTNSLLRVFSCHYQSAQTRHLSSPTHESLLRVFSCHYHSAQARHLSSSTQEKTNKTQETFESNPISEIGQHYIETYFHSVFKCFILSIKLG
jgi:hypothetical protein